MNLFGLLIKLLPTKPVFAHCDIPCGIYDPHSAQLASQTVLKMVQKLKELQKPEDDDWLEYKNSMTRMILVKEQHAEICKKEVLILWTDYFKAEHLEKFPDLHTFGRKSVAKLLAMMFGLKTTILVSMEPSEIPALCASQFPLSMLPRSCFLNGLCINAKQK